MSSGTITRDAYGTRHSAATTRIPFDGPSEIFRYQPNLYWQAPPEAEIDDGTLLLRLVFCAFFALYGNTFQMAPYFVVVLVLAGIGTLVTQALRLVEIRTERWRYDGNG